jgi:hypothetical protein
VTDDETRFGSTETFEPWPGHGQITVIINRRKEERVRENKRRKNRATV